MIVLCVGAIAVCAFSSGMCFVGGNPGLGALNLALVALNVFNLVRVL